MPPTFSAFRQSPRPGHSGDGGPATLDSPLSIQFRADGAVFIGDSGAHKIRVLHRR